MNVKFSPFMPKPPGVQKVAIVLDPALHPRVLQHLSWGALPPQTPHKSAFNPFNLET
ncbi:hypothetical protein M9458_031636, partial [Cirrhinus mrigala]